MTSEELFSVRAARSSDASDISRIYSAAIEARNATMILDPVSEIQMLDKLSSLSDRETVRVIVNDEDQVVGWGIVKLYSDRPGYRLTCETSLFIDQTYRRRGLGERLQMDLLQTARSIGFHHVIVRIWAANQSSIRLHERCGFTMVGIQNQIGHVDSKWIDVAVMQCLLN